MGFYTKKPVTVEARMIEDNGPELVKWIGDKASYVVNAHNVCVVIIETLEGEMRGKDGDWIIKGVKGEFYPCKPDIFAETYGPAENRPSEVAIVQERLTATEVQARRDE